MSFFSNNNIINKDIDFEIENYIFKVPYKYAQYFNPYKKNNDIQSKEYKNFIDLSRDKNVFIDIGSHVGVFLFTFNSLGENKKSFGFDINNNNLDAFKNILSYNKDKRYDNITYYPMGISNKSGTDKVFILTDKIVESYDGLQGMLSVESYEEVRKQISPNFSDKNYIKEVDNTTIDNFSDYLINDLYIVPDILKIDVEGYEEKVLDGGHKTFTHLKPTLLIEIHKDFLPIYNSNINDVYSKIIDYNYEFYDYNRKKIESVEEYQSLFEDNPELRIYCLPKPRKGQ